MNKYILFCAQEANFQTRSMLIPYDKYLMCDNLIKDFDILRKHSKSHIFVIDDQNYTIDNLLIQNFIWHDNMGQMEENGYSQIIGKLADYANGMDENKYYVANDKIWYDHTIIDLCGGFNHIKNFCKLLNMKSFEKKPIEIIEGFLVLETRDGVYELPIVDTVKEMYDKYYSEKLDN
jgi:hypothetical protein